MEIQIEVSVESLNKSIEKEKKLEEDMKADPLLAKTKLKQFEDELNETGIDKLFAPEMDCAQKYAKRGDFDAAAEQVIDCVDRLSPEYLWVCDCVHIGGRRPISRHQRQNNGRFGL